MKGRIAAVVVGAIALGSSSVPVKAAERADPLGDEAVVSCKLPARVHRVNRRVVYVAPRRIAQLTKQDCLKRRGEVVSRPKDDDYDPHAPR